MENDWKDSPIEYSTKRETHHNRPRHDNKRGRASPNGDQLPRKCKQILYGVKFVFPGFPQYTYFVVYQT